MKGFNTKIKLILICIAALILSCACLTVYFTALNVDTQGSSIEFVTESGEKESIEAIGESYGGNGVYVSSFYDSEEERHYMVRALGEDNAVKFKTELTHASNEYGTDTGVFRSVIGISENRVLAFTMNWYYLYAVGENGLEFLDAYGAALDIENYTLDFPQEGRIDIYNLETRGTSSAAKVYAEKISIEGDRFQGSVSGEIKRKSGRRLTSMGAEAKGICVTADHSKVITVFSSATAMMFDSDFRALEIEDADAYAEQVKSVTIGGNGTRVTTAISEYGTGRLYAAMQDCTVQRISERDFDDLNLSSPDVLLKMAEFGSYSALDRVNGVLFLTNEDGNTVYAVDTGSGKLVFSTQLKFKISNMVASQNTDMFVCQWIDSVTDKQAVTTYGYSALNVIDTVAVWKIVCVAGAVVFFVVALFFATFGVSETFAAFCGSKIKWFFVNLWGSKWIYLIILPSFVLLCTFSLYPSVASIINSFYDYELGKPKIFIGFENYRELFVVNSGLLLEIARNTVLMVVTYLFTQIVPPVLYAYLIMLLRNKNSVKIIRLLLYIPGLLPTIATMLMWRYGIYGINPDGAINTIIARVFHGEPVPFLGDSRYAIWSILFIGFPWVGGFLLFYGALMNVPGEIYDACEMDGCGLIKRFFAIDLPFIAGQIKYVSIGAFIAGVKSVGRVMATTDGQMGTMTMMYKLYDYLNQNRYGMASAVAVIMVLLLAGISLLRVRRMLKKEASYD